MEQAKTHENGTQESTSAFGGREGREKAKNAVRKNFTEKMAEKPTRQRAINAFCMQCMGGPENVGWKELIRDCCASPDSRQPCPLHGFRPYRR